jgi:hypothetical protein
MRFINATKEMKISLKTVRSAFLTAMDYVEKRYGPDVELDVDYYWSIPKEAKYDTRQVPTHSDMGSLVHDYSEVEKLAKGEHDIVGYDLVYIGTLLQALGEELS